MYTQYNVVRSYTIEANYNMCNRLNKKVYSEALLNEKTIGQYLNSKCQILNC